MVRKYGGKNYENKKEDKPRSSKAEKKDRESVAKPVLSADVAEKK